MKLNRIAFALLSAAWAFPTWAQQPAAPAAKVEVHTISVTAEIELFPDTVDALHNLPGPLAVVDPATDFDKAVVRRLAYRRAMAEARRLVADRMTGELKDETRWILRKLTFPKVTDVPSTDPLKFTVVAEFARTVEGAAPAAPVGNERPVAQEDIQKLTGKVPVALGFRIDSEAARRVPDGLAGAVKSELRRGDWTLLPQVDAGSDEDVSRMLERVDKEAKLMFLVTVSERLKGEVEIGGSKFYRSQGSAQLSVYRRLANGKWVQVHESRYPDAKSEAHTVFADKPSNSRDSAVRELCERLGKDLVENGYLLDLTARAFADQFKTN